jgi:uncharacterized protein YeeX (DUF496 family)
MGTSGFNWGIGTPRGMLMNGEINSKAIRLSVEPTVEQFRIEYAKADQFCQRVQDFVSEAGIPAINELRNAGHHFLKSIDNDGTLVNATELVSAINHTKRACYEAGEAGILVALDHVRTFREDFRTVQLTGILPDYLEMMQRCEQARQAMLAVRTDDEDRSNDYELRMTAFATLQDICQKLDVARLEAVKLVRKEQIDNQKFILTVLLSILGIAVAIGGTVVTAMLAG